MSYRILISLLALLLSAVGIRVIAHILLLLEKIDNTDRHHILYCEMTLPVS
jgi:hypothetical protein